ncbi:alpha/beta fold hydrolase [Thermoflavimicrobium daqui]|jgi:pimeloyl-ACP methyl ester carboxylesterase|uniref:Alpha/beta hydrolase n=1 Tax=Thermoflavimicrobium daqui TaxID=2137476 RepID=A0A364K4F2_9BACL|nr:alpha/beta hydrolase [Thermoflavimicrobium daqui]RAL24226.1 alpha/beta hydrolase [Thermoflavimicrobium daqui]
MTKHRKYGDPPFSVAVIHGGPGAPGEMAPVEKELSRVCGILEPLQTSESIQGQMEELMSILVKYGKPPITLIGYSWGAWLSFILAANYPSIVCKLILVGSGPFEEKYTSKIMETRLSRLNEKDKQKVYSLQEALLSPSIEDKSLILAQFGKLMSKADSCDPFPTTNEEIEVQIDIYQSVWKEASELRRSEELLKLGKQVQCPVIAIHGDYDPHPYEGVEKPLSKIIKEFRLILLKDCGHIPWKERSAKDRFYKILKEELS